MVETPNENTTELTLCLQLIGQEYFYRFYFKKVPFIDLG